MYAKIFTSIYDGTLGTVGPWEALITFQQMLVLSDRYGVVDMTAEAIARRTTIPINIIKAGIAALEKPDDHSRRSDFDGKRIIRLDDHRDWGWQIVNHAHYRAIRSAEERREYQKNYKREIRAKTKPDNKDIGDAIERIPMIGGEEFEVRQSFVDEMTRLYLNVDVPLTLKEIRGWCIGNPTKLKTPRGIRKFIVSWLQREQDKHGR